MKITGKHFWGALVVLNFCLLILCVAFQRWPQTAIVGVILASNFVNWWNWERETVLPDG